MKLLDCRYERTHWKEGISSVAGIDEAGRGPLAGPVVAAAVVFPPEVWIQGVDDSKNLDAMERERPRTRLPWVVGRTGLEGHGRRPSGRGRPFSDGLRG